MSATSERSRLLLIGAGHAHMEVVRRLITSPHPRLDLVLVSPSDRHHYSGMVPGYLRGTYDEAQISFDLPALAAAAKGEFIRGFAVGVEPARRVVRLEDGKEVEYVVASFNVGSRPLGDDEASVVDNAALVKPMSRAVDLRGRIEGLARGCKTDTRRVVIVGGGAAGIEVACALTAVLDDADCEREVTVVDGSDKVLVGYSDRFRARAERVLGEKRIGTRLGHRVVKVHSDSVELADGSRLGSDLTVWLTGPAAHPLFRDSGLPLDERGFLLVNDSLRSVEDARILAAGDCATLANHPSTPKAGVYAVRQAPVLWESIVATVNKTSLPKYEPQQGFLSLLNTGDGKALARYKGLVGHGRWAWRLKDWIDRSFMARYQKLVS